MPLKEGHSVASSDEPFDILIIGGGINGAGLCEAGAFARGTSLASTKLIHGGLCYLEYPEFRAMREALRERDILLKSMPHISWLMRIVVLIHEKMVFKGRSPISRLPGLLMPWRKNGPPGWTLRAGLFLYDFLAGKTMLPKTRILNLRKQPLNLIAFFVQVLVIRVLEFAMLSRRDHRLAALIINQVHGPVAIIGRSIIT